MTRTTVSTNISSGGASSEVVTPDMNVLLLTELKNVSSKMESMERRQATTEENCSLQVLWQARRCVDKRQ